MQINKFSIIERAKFIQKRIVYINLQMNKQIKSKHFALHQLIDDHYHLNRSNSTSEINQCSLQNASDSINSNKILPLYQQQLGPQKNNNTKIFKVKAHAQKDQPCNLKKSKQLLQKFTNKLSTIPSTAKDKSPAINIVKNQIYEASMDINSQIDKKIQHTFMKILNQETIMPIYQIINKQKQEIQNDLDGQKQNFMPNAVSFVEGTRMLMTQYWQKDKIKKQQYNQDKNIVNKNLFAENKTMNIMDKVSNLPKINEKAYGNLANNPNIILGKINKHQRKRQQQMKNKDEQLKLQFYSFTFHIIDYKIRNESKQFLLFQRVNYKKWQDINFVLKCLEAFCENYKIIQAKLNLKRVLQLVEMGQKKETLKEAFKLQQEHRISNKNLQFKQKKTYIKTQYSAHELLSCLQNAQKISENHPTSKGIRFFGNKGMKRAIIKIQSQFRRFICRKKFQELKKIIGKVILIQRKYRNFIQHQRTKIKISQIQQQKYQKFKDLQKDFRENYRKLQITKKIKYEIHLCSLSSNQWNRVTTENIAQKQNTELSRIFRIATKSNPLMQTRIIYITPNQLPKQVINYYKKIFQFGSESQSDQFSNVDKLNIIWPQNIQKLPETLSLTQKVLYSKQTIKKLKKIIKESYCYIIPSTPSNDFISLSIALNVPLYSAEPQKLLYLQSKSGSKEFAKILKQYKQQDSFGVLPYSANIYNKTSLINQLTFLVLNYPSVRRWVLKIENQNKSRGLAYIDTSKILNQQINKRLLNTENSTKPQTLKQEIYERLYQSLITLKEQRVIPLSKQIYRCQEEYINQFLTNGGIIEASINNFQTDLQNQCFVVQIEPDNEWKFITNYYKITCKNQPVGCYYNCTDQEIMKPPIQIQLMIKQLIKQKLFGFFTFQFLKIPSTSNKINSQRNQNKSANQHYLSCKQKNENNLTYFNGIHCHLDEFSSAAFLIQFLSNNQNNRNVLYIPFLSHPSLKELRIQTFFHLCRLENISFDIQRKIGNVFMFLNGLETGCMGLMSFNGVSKEQTYQQVSDVLQFLSSKLNNSSNLIKKVSKQFMAVRNVVNGYLKKDRNIRLSKEIRKKNMKNGMSCLYRNQSEKNL